MYKNLLMIGAVLFGCMCSRAFGKFDLEPLHVSMLNPVPHVTDLDISQEVNALRTALTDRDNAIKNSKGDKNVIDAAIQQYETIKIQLLDNIVIRRRAQYAQVRILVTCEGINSARINCPYPGLYVVPNSGRTERSAYYSSRGDLRYENNGISHCTKFLPLGRSDDELIRLSVLYAYDDVKLTELVNKDRRVIKLLLEAAL